MAEEREGARSIRSTAFQSMATTWLTGGTAEGKKTWREMGWGDIYLYLSWRESQAIESKCPWLYWSLLLPNEMSLRWGLKQTLPGFPGSFWHVSFITTTTIWEEEPKQIGWNVSKGYSENRMRKRWLRKKVKYSLLISMLLGIPTWFKICSIGQDSTITCNNYSSFLSLWHKLCWKALNYQCNIIKKQLKHKRLNKLI